MVHQPHVGDRIQRRAAGQHEFVTAGGADQMADDMEQRVLEHELRRGGFVEPLLRVDRFTTDIDPHDRIRVPHLLRRDRWPKNLEQRR